MTYTSHYSLNEIQDKTKNKFLHKSRSGIELSTNEKILKKVSIKDFVRRNRRDCQAIWYSKNQKIGINCQLKKNINTDEPLGTREF